MKKKWVRGSFILLALLAALQCIRPERSNPPVDSTKTIQAHLAVPESVDVILRRSCYDCHSNESRWPWYSNVAPVSWLVARDVEVGRRNLNFSEWGDYKMGRALSMLERICDETTTGEMPLGIYLTLHPDAELTPEEITQLCAWADSEMDRLSED